jgi:hypothetical protein
MKSVMNESREYRTMLARMQLKHEVQAYNDKDVAVDCIKARIRMGTTDLGSNSAISDPMNKDNWY